jgi:WhiB family redox-sensing transcriptional regulator
MFFAPVAGERAADRSAREQQAKAVCQRCPVVDPCLSYALRIREPHGVWGGLNEIERQALLAERTS